MKPKIVKILFMAAIVALLSTVSNATPQNIEANGEYMMATSDTLNDAKDKALQEALRNAVEKAGVYVESYTKVKDMILTKDQIRVLAGNIIKIENKTFSTIASGNTFLIKCNIQAIIDTDSIDLQRVMKMKKTQEENIRLTKTVADLKAESDSLRQKYLQTQSESEKLKIKNEWLITERELGNLYKHDYQGDNILREVNAATAEFSNFGKLYPDMPDNEFRIQIEQQLYASGWGKGQTFANGAKYFNKKIDSNFTEKLSYNPMEKSNYIFFETSSKVAADKLFTIIFSNMYTLFGKPRMYDLEDGRAVWEKEQSQGKKYTTRIYKHYRDDKYMIGIAKEFHNELAKKHFKFSMEETLINLSPVKGDWYNDQGDKVLSITKDGYINGCKVIEGFDFAGGTGQYGVYRIMETTGIRDITIEKLSPKLIKIDNNIILTNTANDSYYESVNGVYLGMSSAKVAARLGKPDEELNNPTRWIYKSLGLNILFETDRVIQIEMLNNGKWFLDKSKLNYRNSIDDYVKAYNLSEMPKPLSEEDKKHGYYTCGYMIAKGEFLWFPYYPEN